MKINFREKNIEIVRGENASLFFSCVDSHGNGIDLSGSDASLVIKRYPTSSRILFFMDDDSAIHGASAGDFIYSPTASSNGVGNSVVNEDITGNSLVGGIVFPLYGGDTTNIPRGIHFYEVSILDRQNKRHMAYEGRVDVHDPMQSPIQGDVRQKNIEIAQNETMKLFFKYVDKNGDGIGLSGGVARMLIRRYPASSSMLFMISQNQVRADESNYELTGGTYSHVDVDMNLNPLSGGILFLSPHEATEKIPSGRHFYEVQITGATSFVAFEGRFDVFPKYHDYP